ncbi:MAG TPA: glycosyltransferase [Chloroflexi bacterium]|nr:glycosyltransferase [Chloroflexota bacterium]HAL26148.1 glycosyltransferase [Chloroflexota bacterium]
MTRVHQFHPVLGPGDAMSNHVFALQERLRGWGHDAHAYAIEAKTGAQDVLPYRRLFRDVGSDDLVLLHFSMGNEVFTQLAKLRARKVLVYHNVTPAEFFRGINAHAATHARLGRRQLVELAPAMDLAIGVSAYNQHELDAAGYARTAHVPILIDWRQYDQPPDDAVMARWDRVRPLLLFVGRVSPHKRQDDLIRMLAYYRACVDPNARLVLVGSYRDQPQYHARLVELVKALHLEPAVTFAGVVSTAELVAYFRSASAFVSLSEHEGFGVPLLEAMRFDVPVIAYDAAAVGETVGGAGVLLADRDLAQAAEAVGLVLERRELREQLVTAGRQRLEAFDPDRVAERTREVLGL